MFCGLENVSYTCRKPFEILRTSHLKFSQTAVETKLPVFQGFYLPISNFFAPWQPRGKKNQPRLGGLAVHDFEAIQITQFCK